MQQWRLLDTETSVDALMNMAIEEAIFLARVEKAVPPTIRFWRNDRAVLIGYSQNVNAGVNLKFCERGGIQVVRRFSGGGAVYHDLGNLNYTIVLDVDHQLIRGLDIAESYKFLCSGMIEGLRTLGVQASFRPSSDLFVGERKISGSAQSRKRGVVLHHGTLLVNSDLDLLMEALDVRPEKVSGKRVCSVKKPVTRLRDELGWEVEMTSLKVILARGFERAFSIRLAQGTITSLEQETAQNLYRDKYSRREWNFWR